MAAAQHKEEIALHNTPYPPPNSPYPPQNAPPYPSPQSNAAGYPPPNDVNRRNSQTDHQPKKQESRGKGVKTLLNYEQRDPNNLNPFLRLTFNDVFGEPEPGIFSSDGVYKCSFDTYSTTKRWCYRILAYIFNVPLAIFWALWFGCFSYVFIWCCVPFLRCCRVQCRCIGELNKACLDACIAPFCEAFGRCLGHIHLRHSRYSSSVLDELDPASKRDVAHLA